MNRFRSQQSVQACLDDLVRHLPQQHDGLDRVLCAQRENARAVNAGEKLTKYGAPFPANLLGGDGHARVDRKSVV